MSNYRQLKRFQGIDWRLLTQCPKASDSFLILLVYSYNLSPYTGMIWFHMYFCPWCIQNGANHSCQTQKDTRFLCWNFRSRSMQSQTRAKLETSGWLVVHSFKWSRTLPGCTVLCCFGWNKGSEGLSETAWVFLAISSRNSDTQWQNWVYGTFAQVQITWFSHCLLFQVLVCFALLTCHDTGDKFLLLSLSLSTNCGTWLLFVRLPLKKIFFPDHTLCTYF